MEKPSKKKYAVSPSYNIHGLAPPLHPSTTTPHLTAFTAFTAPFRNEEEKAEKISSSHDRPDKRGFFGLFKRKKDGEPLVVIGEPFGLQHHVHVDFNAKSGFVGLPPEWEAELLGSGVSFIFIFMLLYFSF